VSLLFGSMLSVRPGEITLMLMCALVVLIALATISRPLFFATVDPVGAIAKGLPTTFLSIAFALILTVAVAMCVLSIGALLAISLLVAPPAAALRLARQPARAILVSAALGLFVAWGGLFASFFGPWKHPPIGFSIASLAAAVYFLSWVLGSRRGGRRIAEYEHPSRETSSE